jgi:hypothetical protein
MAETMINARARILLGGVLLGLMSAYFGVYAYSVTLPKKGSYAGFSATWDAMSEPRITKVDPTALATDFNSTLSILALTKSPQRQLGDR